MIYSRAEVFRKGAEFSESLVNHQVLWVICYATRHHRLTLIYSFHTGGNRRVFANGTSKRLYCCWHAKH